MTNENEKTDVAQAVKRAAQKNTETVGEGSIRIVSKRKGGIGPVAGETVVDVDRTHPILGNRHILHNYRDNDERSQVIAAYEDDFIADVARNGPMVREVERLADQVKNGGRIALRCWCAPRPCHADVLGAMIAELAGVSFTPGEDAASKKAASEDQGSLF